MDYAESIAYIAALAPRGWRMGLDRMRQFVDWAGLTDSLGSPAGPQFVHVAGTNGKGSVTAYLQSIMALHGCRTGAYYSPYVYSPCERIQLGRTPISPEEFAMLATEIRPVSERFDGTELGGISEFEFKTAMGFLCWKRNRCEWVALEVGLGANLDATNVIESASSALVSVGLDHTSVLGETLAEIALEKCGVMRSGKVTAVGILPDEAMAIAEAEAHKREAALWRLGREIRVVGDTVSTPGRTISGVHPGIGGIRQAENLAIALAAWDGAGGAWDDETVREAARTTRLPGRFEERKVRGHTVILDGAHNGEAALWLRESLLSRFPNERWTLVTGMVAGHDPARFYGPLLDVVEQVIFVPIDFRRAVPPQELADRRLFSRQTVASSVSEGVSIALAQPSPVLVTGSFYLVGETGAILEEFS